VPPHKGTVVRSGEVTEFGIYSAEVVKKVPAPGVATGTNEALSSFKLIQSTTNVPAKIGTRFGFRYRIKGSPTNAPIVLTMVGEHPPYKNPKTGKSQARDEYQLESWIGETYTSYLLENEWELIPGPFKFEVWHQGKKLCEQAFMITADANRDSKTGRAERQQ
jgi:hypothetical protein